MNQEEGSKLKRMSQNELLKKTNYFHLFQLLLCVSRLLSTAVVDALNFERYLPELLLAFFLDSLQQNMTQKLALEMSSWLKLQPYVVFK